MSQSPTVVRILILTDDPATADRWAGMLGGAEFDVRFAVDEVFEPEVVLTDAPPSAVPRQEAQPVGVVAIGPPGEADVCLPADATARELQLACRLLAEVVRLRRSHWTITQVQRRLQEKVFSDPLTNLPNRRAWDRTLGRRLRSIGPDGGPFVVALVDLDHFKSINDRLGHAAGDEVLRGVGAALSESLRRHDFVARLGGDEFVLLLEDLAFPQAEPVLDRVRQAVPTVLARRGAEPVTASIGFCRPINGDTPERVITRASTALGVAKRQGRDRVVGSDPRGQPRSD